MTIKDSVANGINQTKEALNSTVAQAREKMDEALGERKLPESSRQRDADVDMRDDFRPPSTSAEKTDGANVLGGMTPPKPSGVKTPERSDSIKAARGATLDR